MAVTEDGADVAVVGGGPAGLAAALEVARAGGAVTLVERGPKLGGQYFKPTSGAHGARPQTHRRLGVEMADRLRDVGANILLDTTAWSLDSSGRLLLSGPPGGPVETRARAVVVATGATERQVPFPGWTLPGVVAGGNAMHLAACDGVQVGSRAIVAGSGPFLLPVACELLRLGVDVLAVLEAGRPYRPTPRSVTAALHPGAAAQFARYRARLMAARVPLLQGWRVVRAEGDQAVSSVVGASSCSQRTWAVDALVVGHGFRPATELLRAAGAQTRVDPPSLDDVPVLGVGLQTSLSAIFAAGEVAGIAGVGSAMARGAVAGAAAAEHAGLSVPRQRRNRLRRAVQRQDRQAVRLWSLFPPPTGLLRGLPEDTVICRCEAVPLAAVTAARAELGDDVEAIKMLTRCGMGPCQGRLCSWALSWLMSAERDSVQFRSQVPAFPVRIDTVVSAGDQ